MKNRAIRFVIFFIILFLGLAIIEILAINMYAPESDLYVQHENFRKKINIVETVILGSSYAAGGVNPKYINGTSYNLAYSAQDIYYDYMILTKYINDMPRLKHVILEVSYFSLYYDESDNTPYLLKDYFSTLGIVPRRITSAFFKNISIFFIHQAEFLKDLIGHKERETFVFVDGDTMDEVTANNALLNNGCRLWRGTMNRSAMEADGKSKALSHSGFRRNNRQTENLLIMQKILTLLRHKNINAIIITTPYTDFYSKSFNKLYVRQFFNTMEKMCAKNPHCRYIDFSNSGDFSNDDFLNSDHLNYKGAEKLSGKINALLFNGSADHISNYGKESRRR